MKDKELGKDPQFRIEIKAVPYDLAMKLLDVRVACPHCQTLYDPFRKRAAKPLRPEAIRLAKYLYYAGSHSPSPEHPGCSKGKGVTENYKRIEYDIKVWESEKEST